jgi:hypothetical protein
MLKRIRGIRKIGLRSICFGIGKKLLVSVCESKG